MNCREHRLSVPALCVAAEKERDVRREEFANRLNMAGYKEG
jgi:hypothetical protein